MRQVWKYDLPVESVIRLSMPIGAQILHLAPQRDRVCVWALVNPNNDKEFRRFAVVGTGHDVPENTKHVGTWLMDDGQFVWHLFEAVSA